MFTHVDTLHERERQTEHGRTDGHGTTACVKYSINYRYTWQVMMMYRHEVLAISEGIDVDTHALKWDLVLCLLFAWIFVFFCTIGGVKSVGKVMTFRFVAPWHFIMRPTHTMPHYALHPLSVGLSVSCPCTVNSKTKKSNHTTLKLRREITYVKSNCMAEQFWGQMVKDQGHWWRKREGRISRW